MPESYVDRAGFCRSFDIEGYYLRSFSQSALDVSLRNTRNEREVLLSYAKECKEQVDCYQQASVSSKKVQVNRMT
jgi:hypothetical protein